MMVTSKRIPRVVKHRDLIIVTPAGSARMRANIILIRSETGDFTFIDCGSQIDPGKELLSQVFKKYAVTKAANISLLLTHSHNDHVSNLWWLRSQFPQLKSFASEAEYPLIKYPYIGSPHMDRINAMVGTQRPVNILRRIALIALIPRMFGMSRFYNPVDFTFSEKTSCLKIGGRKIETILTPGHSPGHCAYLDESKYLFLGDLVPNTPWLDPDPSSLTQMIASIQKVLRLPDRKVEYTVRSHCNAADHGRFIYPWAEERARFESFLDLINKTLEKIPALLRGRIVSTWEVGVEILKNMSKYLGFMTRFWVPPGMSWIVGYLSYLEQTGKIQRITGYRQVAWTS